MNELRTRDPSAPDPMDDVFRGMLKPWRNDLSGQTPRISVDVAETAELYTVKADIPGVNKTDIDVRIDRNVVTISAEVKKEEEEKKDGRILRAERRYGYASRSFALDSDVDETKALANYKDGVLHLTLPKKESSASRRVNVE